MEEPAKLTVLVPLKVSDAMAREIRKFAGGSRKRPEFIRGAIVEKITRTKEELTPKVTPEAARLAAELTRLGGSPEMALRNALAEIERDEALSQPASR